jgi:hypothetical protein
MKQTIITYLSGPRNYNEGVALYQRYGSNLRLKRQFAVTSTSFSKELLYDELRKLAGLTEAEYKNLPRLAAQKKVVATETVADKETKAKDDEDVLVELARNLGVTVDDLVSPEFQERVLALPEVENRIAEITEELEEVRSKYAAAPETVRKMIRLRERFPFLNSPDCPDELKILVADMLTAYGAYKAAFARLQELGDEESAKAAADCETVVTEYIENREIWDELEYYKENGQILGKAAKLQANDTDDEEDYTQLSDVDLVAKLRSAQVNESKQKRNVAIAKEKGETNERAEAAYEMWAARKQALQDELAHRKKK